MASDFEDKFKKHLKEKIPMEADHYKELQYSDNIYVHVASHPNGEGSFELYAIVPHDSVEDPSLVGRDSQSSLPMEVPTAEQFYDDIDRLVEEVIGRDLKSSEITFHLMEVVDDGAWERPATMYCTHELTAE